MPSSPSEFTDALLSRGERPSTAAAHRFILGGPFGSEPLKSSFERLTHFAEAGGLLVETARSYAGGAAEESVGQWVRKNPGVLGVVTKVGHDHTGQDLPLTRETVHTHVHASLKTLGVEAIDVLLLHCDDPARPVDELAETLLSLIEAGYAHHVGASNWQADRLNDLAFALHRRGRTPAASYQFSLAEPDPAQIGPSRHASSAVRAVVLDHHLPLLTWSSQARGFFARTGPKAPDNGRPDPFERAENRARRERCRQLGGQLDARPETVALAWLLHHPEAWPSIGPRTAQQLDRSLDALKLALTEEQVRWLETGL